MGSTSTNPIFFGILLDATMGTSRTDTLPASVDNLGRNGVKGILEIRHSNFPRVKSFVCFAGFELSLHRTKRFVLE